MAGRAYIDGGEAGKANSLHHEDKAAPPFERPPAPFKKQVRDIAPPYKPRKPVEIIADMEVLGNTVSHFLELDLNDLPPERQAPEIVSYGPARNRGIRNKPEKATAKGKTLGRVGRNS